MMTEELLTNNLTKRLHPSIKNSFWTQFIEAISSEIWVEHEEKFLKQDMFNIDTLTSEEICALAQDMLGYTIDLSISNDLDFVKKVFRAIPWLIINKTVYSSFDFIFKSLEMTGYVYLMYFSSASSKLLRLLDKDAICRKIDNYYDFTTPFYWFIPDKTTSVNLLQKTPTLDSDLYGVDGDEVYYLDKSIEKLTKHLALEYNLINYEEVRGVKYLFQKKYLDYLKNNGNYCKKVTDIPHYGCNLTFPIDFRNGTTNFIPDLSMNIATYDFYDNIFEDLMITGIVEYEDGTETELGLYAVTIEEILYYEEFIMILGLFKSRIGSKIFKNIGIITTYSSTLNTKNIVESKVSGTLSFSDGSKVTFIDDGTGSLYNKDNLFLSGTIEYTTGNFTLNLFNYTSKNPVIGEITDHLTYETGYTVIKEGTLKLSFDIDGTTYTASDDSNGHIISPYLTNSTIVYSTGVLYFETIYTITNCNSSFSSRNDYIYSSTPTHIWIDYQIDDNVKLKEVNIYTDVYATNKLLLNATFPYIEMQDLDQHVSLQFLIRAPGINLDSLDIGKRFDNTPFLRVDRSRRFN